jgi:hypothetical protein
MSNYIRPMSFGELFRSFFGVYKKAFWFLTLFTIVFLVIYFCLDYFGWKLLSSIAEESLPSNARLFLINLTDFLMPIFAVGPVLITVSSVILNRQVSFKESIQKGLSISLLLKILLVSGIFILISVFLCTWAFINTPYGWKVLNGFFLFVYIFATQIWIFFPMVIVLEKKGIFPAIGRSFSFLLRSLKNLFLIDLLIFILAVVISYPLQLLINTKALTTPAYVIVIPIITTISLTFYVLVYFETRARRENYSADELSQELGFAPLEEMISM